MSAHLSLKTLLCPDFTPHFEDDKTSTGLNLKPHHRLGRAWLSTAAPSHPLSLFCEGIIRKLEKALDLKLCNAFCGLKISLLPHFFPFWAT